jgi:hypothetical protein
MAKIYLTGAVTDFDDPFKWHDEISESEKYSEHEFINPYTLNDFELGDDGIYEHPDRVVEPALDEVADADGMLVYWDDDVFLVGTSMEMKHAYENGVPIVLWYEGWKDNLSPWLLHTTKGHFEKREKALKVLLTFAGDGFVIKENI